MLTLTMCIGRVGNVMISRIGAAVTLSLMMLFSLACERAEIVDRYYPSYEHLGKSDEPGNWVPTFLPRSAVEIRARYKIDTGAELLMFYSGKPEELSAVSNCEKATMSDLQLPPPGFLDVGWWPNSLYRNPNQKDGHASYVFYTCERQAFLALERKESRTHAYYWRISLVNSAK